MECWHNEHNEVCLGIKHLTTRMKQQIWQYSESSWNLQLCELEWLVSSPFAAVTATLLFGLSARLSGAWTIIFRVAADSLCCTEFSVRKRVYFNSQLNKNYWKLLCVLNILATAVQSAGLSVEQLWNDMVMGRNKNVPSLKLLQRQTHISEQISSAFCTLIQHPFISKIIVKVEQIKQILQKKFDIFVCFSIPGKWTICQVKCTLWRSCTVRRGAIYAFPHLPRLIHLSWPQPWGAAQSVANLPDPLVST